MRKPYWMVAWILIIEVLVVLLLAPTDWTDQSIEKESVLIEKMMGKESSSWIYDHADQWYQSWILDSGFYDRAYHFLIPNEQDKINSGAMANVGEPVFNYLATRIQAMTNMVYQLFVRGSLLTLWLPFMLIIFLPALFDGAMSWKIKQISFDYASPVIHRYSVRSLVYLILGLFLMIFLPFALSPILFPIIMISCCILIGLMTSNIQKRI